VEDNNLGSPPNEELLNAIRPNWWFSAHLHVKFEASIRHRRAAAADAAPAAPICLVPSQVAGGSGSVRRSEEIPETNVARAEGVTNFVGLESSSCPTSNALPDLTEQMTRFLSLDKALPRRQHLQILNIVVDEECDDDDEESHDAGGEKVAHQLEYDLEWLAILKKTHALTRAHPSFVAVPREPLTVSEDDLEDVRARLRRRHAESRSRGAEESRGNPFAVPRNFRVTVPPHDAPGSHVPPCGGRMIGNPQTDELLRVMGLPHVVTVPFSGGCDAVPPPSKISAARPVDWDKDEIKFSETEDESRGESAKGARDDGNEIDLDDDSSNEPQANGDTPEVKKQQTGTPDATRPINLDKHESGHDQTEDKGTAESIQGAKDDGNEIDLDDDASEEMQAGDGSPGVKKQRTGSPDNKHR